MTDSSLSTRYDPKQVEERWYSIWEANGLFRPEYTPDGASPSRPTYCITIPPPNVTGSLHMGHALCYSVQDVLGRWKRMTGHEVLVLPGIDHAGIATQKVVEAQLKQEGISKHDLGREKFVERVWAWKNESGSTILKQFKRLGFAFDWSRERFTMDTAYHDAVLRVFIDWFERGLIYRGKRIVNWDPGLRTSVSDIEVYDETRKGKLYHIRYPFADGGHIVIATTRPETMLADVAVAVHPNDERYKALVGKTILLPLVGRKIPLIPDEFPDPNFGSGAVKVTPAHDPNDYEIGVRMGLDFSDSNQVPVCIDDRAAIIAPNTPYHGLDRYEARKKIVADLELQGLIERIEDYEVPLKISDRSGQVIEPLLSEQWFCKMKQLAAPAIEAVKSGKIKFTPERYTDIYLRWMENIKDWCVSRQLWWGHRIPIYYTQDGKALAAMTQQEAEERSGGPVTPDPDVLDTWFSSALWPFATLGWPENTPDFCKFYPTNVLITDKGIIYLWVARMVMDGLDQAGDIPFSDVYVHATVLTDTGQRMSKSLGTGVDPVEYIDRFGADAMRFSLLVQTGFNQEIRFGEKRIEEARNFCNKIWNAARFALLNLDGLRVPEFQYSSQFELPFAFLRSELELEDRWILSRLRSCASTVSQSLQVYNMMDACKSLYEFFWGDFCDWYIEATKIRLADTNKREIPQKVVYCILDGFCRLMHPFTPHITEEVWHKLPGIPTNAYLDYAPWPSYPDSFCDPDAEREMAKTQEVVRTARNLRQEFDISPKAFLPALYLTGFDGDTTLIATQSKFDKVISGIPDGPHVSATTSGTEVHLPIAGLIDPKKEIERLSRTRAKALAEREQIMTRLTNPLFIQRANPEVVERDKQAADGLSRQIEALDERIKQFRQML